MPESNIEPRIYSEIRKRSRKAGLPPGSLVYTGEKKIVSTVTLVSYDPSNYQEASGTILEEILSKRIPDGITWINVVGLNNVDLIKKIGDEFHLHPLLLEDILNTNQRTKIEDFDHYIFVVVKIVENIPERKNFSIQQCSFVLGQNFFLSFQEQPSKVFLPIFERLKHPQSRLRNHRTDYLLYSLLDILVDQHFIALDALSDQIEEIEELVLSKPSPKNVNLLYKLKRKLLLFRKSVWPMREIVNHLIQSETTFVTSFTIPYFRDLYDHSIQVMDTTDTFRDILSSILDVYLSTLANRTNEIMKVLTIIATIFIPLTFITSIFSMNLNYIPGYSWRWSWEAVMIVSILIGIGMGIYFYRKKWL